MELSPQSGNSACYLGERRSVAAPDWLMAETHLNPATTESAWLAWGRSLFALLVVLSLTALGIANVALYSRWHDVEDGVLWGMRAEGVTAIEVAADSAGVGAGIQRGDVLLAVSGTPVHTPADVVAIHHQAHEGTP